MKSEEDLNRVMESYADLVKRICIVHVKSQHDTEDIFQNVYLKYLLHEGTFESAEHEKSMVYPGYDQCLHGLAAVFFT